jgi:hypothetical protein
MIEWKKNCGCPYRDWKINMKLVILEEFKVFEGWSRKSIALVH